MSSRPTNAYGWYVAIVLLVGLTFSFIDRQVLNLLVVPIQADLKISDTQISALQGLAFVLTYVGLCIPVGRLIDRFNRVLIMVGGILIWSIATIACGLSRNYSEMFTARLGVGAGEATIHPGAVSVLGDYFSPGEMARPLSVYMMGPYLGAGIAMIFGAQVLEWTTEMDVIYFPILGEISAWQLTFISVGLPGFLIAGLFLTIAEPKRTGRGLESQSVPSWSQIIQYIISKRSVYAAIILGNSALIIMLYGLQSWVPTMLLRVFEWDLIQSGRVYGVVALISGSAGVLSGPFAVRYLERRNQTAAALKVAMAGATISTISLAILAFSPNAELALTCVSIASFFVTFPLAGTTSAIVVVTPNEMRGVITALYVVITSIFGLVLGPTLVATSTDFIFQDPKAVAKSLSLVAMLVLPMGIALMWNGSEDFETAKKSAIS
jgi:MFS family permease